MYCLAIPGLNVCDCVKMKRGIIHHMPCLILSSDKEDEMKCVRVEAKVDTEKQPERHHISQAHRERPDIPQSTLNSINNTVTVSSVSYLGT